MKNGGTIFFCGDINLKGHDIIKIGLSVQRSLRTPGIKVNAIVPWISLLTMLSVALHADSIIYY